MPTYLCHGFRWQRQSIRVFVVVQDLDDASPEWIIRPGTSRTLLESFYALFEFLPYCAPPGSGRSRSAGGSDYGYDDDGGGGSRNGRRGGGSASGFRLRSRSQKRQKNPPTTAAAAAGQAQHDAEDDVLSQDWSAVKVLEEYDPLNLEEVSRPHAYVADYAVRVDLSASIAEEIARYEERVRGDADPPMAPGAASDETAAALGGRGRKGSSKKQGWLEKLRDQLQRGEDIRWYVVVNGDEERNWPDEPPARQQQQQQQRAERRPQETQQPQIFEGPDRERERERLRYELGGDRDILGTNERGDRGGGYSSRNRDRDRGQDRERERDRRPSVPAKNMAPPSSGPMRPTMSVDGGARPKTPKAGGLRRLFGRGRASDDSP